MTDSKTREAFEAWARSVMPGCDISMLQGAEGVYSNIFLEESWTAYQAARRAALEEAIGTLDEFEPSMSEEGSSYYLRRIEMAIRALADETQEG